jgi:hypothetical protein
MKPANYWNFRLLFLFWLRLLFTLSWLAHRCRIICYLCRWIILALLTWLIWLYHKNLLSVCAWLFGWTYFSRSLRLDILIWLAVHHLVETHITIFKKWLKLLLCKLTGSHRLSRHKLRVKSPCRLLTKITIQILIFWQSGLLRTADLLLTHLKILCRLIRLLLLCCYHKRCCRRKIISLNQIILRSLIIQRQTCLFFLEIYCVVCSNSY